MKSAYIFHDAFSDPTSDWYPWLKTSLESLGYFVVIPSFPTPGGQTYTSWKAVIKKYQDKFDSETILIGHGTGGLFALGLTEELSSPIGGLFLVASYAEKIGHAGYDRVNETFMKDFSWDTIKSHTTTIEILAGSDDPFVPTALTEKLADSLGCTPHLLPDGGHINRASGFTQLIPLVQLIKERMSRIEKSIAVEEAPSTAIQEDEIPLPPEPAQISESAPLPTGEDAPRNRGAGEGIHTMYQDMSKLVHSNTGTVASSLLTKAREDTEQRQAASPASPKNILYIIGTLIALAGALGIGFYIYQQQLPAAQQRTAENIPSLISAEKHTRVLVEQYQPGFELQQELEKVLATPTEPGTVQDIYYVTNGTRTPIALIFSLLGITTTPPGLFEQIPNATNITPSFMHGTTSNGHFLVMKITRYDEAFSLLRAWEPTMFRDLALFMHVSDQFIRTQTSHAVFQDELVSNRTVRVLRFKQPVSDVPLAETILSPYEENEVMLAYFFLTEQTLVIVDNLALIPEIVTRWANSQIY